MQTVYTRQGLQNGRLCFKNFKRIGILNITEPTMILIAQKHWIKTYLSTFYLLNCNYAPKNIYCCWMMTRFISHYHHVTDEPKQYMSYLCSHIYTTFTLFTMQQFVLYCINILPGHQLLYFNIKEQRKLTQLKQCAEYTNINLLF